MKPPVKNVDFGKTAQDYLTHRAGFPASLFSELSHFDIGRANQTVIDLGTGTGTLGRGLARTGANVIGLDPAIEMLRAARVSDVRENLLISYVNAQAEFTGLATNSVDVVTAGQCWHWFDSDLATSEIQRILKPNGKLAVAYYDWLPIKNNVVRRTEELIERYNPAWRGGNLTGIHPGLFKDVSNAGFLNIRSLTYDEPAIYNHIGWRGRIRASAGVAATLDAQSVAAFDQELDAMLRSDFAVEPMIVPHRVFLLYAEAGM